MKLFFTLVLCLICFCFSGCDPIYNNKSNPLSIKVNSSVSTYLKVEGVLDVFPDLKKVYINSKNNKILKDEILVIIFHNEEDLFAFKNKTDRESNKSILNIKPKIDTQKEIYAIVRTTSAVPYVLSLNNITVFKNGLWIIFYSETNQDIETSLEFKRIGVDEIPKTSMISI